jgi:xanthine dehydrogenase YagS FAD-binding subunit
MNSFEYALPTSEAEAVALLSDHDGSTAILAGGTDLFNLLKADLVAPRRVVDLKNIASLRGVEETGDGLLIGALMTLDELQEHPLLRPYASLRQIAQAIPAVQIQSMGTLGGDLCLLPNCWYFRNGYGMLGLQEGKSLVADGRNEFHAVFGNRGPAKFVSASRFAPSLIAWGAKVRIAGPNPDDSHVLPLEYFYVTPRNEGQGIHVLKPGQFVTHIWLPHAASQQLSAAYEALQMRGLDWPLAAAAVWLEMSGSLVTEARVVLGHVAPIPWVSFDAAETLLGKIVSEETAGAAADAAVRGATPLSENEYKVQIARAAVKRALLRAAGLLEGDV